MNKLQGEDKCVDNQDETQMNWKWRCFDAEPQIAFSPHAEDPLDLKPKSTNMQKKNCKS